MLILDAINDSLYEGALLRSLKKSHCPCLRYKIILPENKMPQSFDISYVTSPSGTLPSLLKLQLCGQNGLILDVTEFTLTYKLKHTKALGLKPLGLDPRYHPVDGPYLNLL